jgi:hypothetical protein
MHYERVRIQFDHANEIKETFAERRPNKTKVSPEILAALQFLIPRYGSQNPIVRNQTRRRF